MFLAVDIGNTNINFGFFDPSGKLKYRGKISTYPQKTSDELKSIILPLTDAQKISWENTRNVLISSVVPNYQPAFRDLFKGKNIQFIDHRFPFSFSVDLKHPEEVGADRIVNAEAAVRDYGAPILIVDSGTATTLCAVTADGRYIGGAIMPGISGSVESLAKKTAKLFTVELTPPETAIGRNTEEALRSGITLGYAEMIDGMIRRFKKELEEEKLKVIGTGGVSDLLQGVASEITHYDPHLTLKGIYYLYEKIRS